MILLIRMIQGIFRQTDRLWTIGGNPTRPSDDDIRKVLDSAAATMYSRDIGSFTMGGLHIEPSESNPREFDVYVHVGTYT